MMTEDKAPINYSKKQVLANPLNLYASLHPHAQTQDIDQLQLLWQQYLTLKQRHKQLQIKTKKLSRQIGEAKHNHPEVNQQAINDLKSAMQLLSQQIRSSSQQSGDLEKEILSYFRETTDADNTEQPLPVSNYGKRDYLDTVDIEAISVSLLDYDLLAWNNYVEKHPAGCIHHRSEWLDLLKNTYNHQCLYFAAYDIDNKIVGILPLVRLKSRLFGDLLVSMPYFQHAGAIADHPLIEDKLMQLANRHAEGLGIEQVEYRDDITRENLPVQSHKVNMVLALPQDSNTLWHGFSSKLRAQIKRPQRENPEISFGREELLDAFYAVYSRNMRDLGSPAHSKAFIANILHAFPDNSWIAVVKLKNKPVGAALLLAYGDSMEIPLASTIRDVNHLSLNMLLYWEVLQFAIKKGSRYFDFGRSTRGAGTYRFKQQWGALPQALYWHYWLSEGSSLPGLNSDNPKFALLINIWKLLPLKLSQWIGPHIVKNIP